MTKTDRIDEILSDAIVDETGTLGEIIGACDHLSELLLACASLPRREEGYVDWARAKAKRLRKLSRQLEEVVEDHWSVGA